MTDKNIKVLQRETYLKMIENSPGTRLFNSVIVRYKDTDNIKDICNNGEFSCAVFVSSVLYLTHYLNNVSATVLSLQKHLKESGWKIVHNKIQPGDIIIWEPVVFANSTHNKHIGFALSATKAVSTSWQTQQVEKHHITFGIDKKQNPKRKIIAQLRYDRYI